MPDAVLFDTSVLVPALVPALPQHGTAAPHLEAAKRGEVHLLLSAHALSECYASLTALPVSPHITPGQARRLVEENLAEPADEIISLAPDDYRRALRRMTGLGLESGAVYDALHVICAEKASADELRTLNGRDFRRMPPEGPTTLSVL